MEHLGAHLGCRVANLGHLEANIVIGCLEANLGPVEANLEHLKANLGHLEYTTQKTQNFGAHFAPTQEV